MEGGNREGSNERHFRMGGGEIENSILFGGSQASFPCLLGNSFMKTGKKETGNTLALGRRFLEKVQRNFGFLLLLKRAIWKFKLIIFNFIAVGLILIN